MDQKATTELWRQADSILEQLLDFDQPRRYQRLERLTSPGPLRDRVEHLLEALGRPGILDRDCLAGFKPDPANRPPDLSGKQFGNYRLESLLGRGGMSAVYKATRVDGAYDTPVALKLLNPALLSTDWHERFQREAGFLASLRHPHISSLLDAGVAADGTPWLVTELVEGEPIDRYCSQHALAPARRVELVRDLCTAVAFAQKNLIIHRDIKPDNVLVTAAGRVVLLDFGIARALDPVSGQSPEVSITRVFTPQYAAPEQLAGQRVTTATDVFALGCLLYQVLTETPAFSTAVSRAPSQSIVRPSLRVAAKDGMNPAERKNSVRPLKGDLDNIVLKALSDSVEQRYANAEQLQQELQAWLEHRPVRACPPSLVDRLRLFWKRRTALARALTALIMVALLGIIATLWQAGQVRIQAEQARLHAEQAIAESHRAEATRDFLVQLFEANNPDIAQGNMPTARDLLDLGAYQIEAAFSNVPDVRAEMQSLIGGLYRMLGDYDAARPLLEQGLAEAERLDQTALRVDAMSRLAQLEIESGQTQTALELLEQADTLLIENGMVPGNQHAQINEQLIYALAETGGPEQALLRASTALDAARLDPSVPAEALWEYIFALSRTHLAMYQHSDAVQLALELLEFPDPSVLTPARAVSLHTNLAAALEGMGNLSEALEHRRAVVEIQQQIYPPLHYKHAQGLSNLASTLMGLGRYHEAEAALRQALEIYGHVHPDHDHPRLWAPYNNQGLTLGMMHQDEQAEAHLTKAVELAKTHFGSLDARHGTSLNNLSGVYRRLGRHQEAIAYSRQGLEVRSQALGPDHWLVGNSRANMARAYLAAGDAARALEQADLALANYRNAGFDNPGFVVAAMTPRASALAKLGRYAEAEQVFNEALALSDATVEDAGSERPGLLAAYAQFLAADNREEAPDAAMRALESHRETFGEQHPATLQMKALVEALLSG